LKQQLTQKEKEARDKLCEIKENFERNLKEVNQLLQEEPDDPYLKGDQRFIKKVLKRLSRLDTP
jgi:hypothetical protein